MKALSIRQPWAWLIVNDHKDIENRTWKTNFRGHILVHAGKTFDKAGYNWVQDACRDIVMPAPKEFEMGGIVGAVDIVDCVKYDRHFASMWFEGPYGFFLENPYPVPFVPLKGKLGFFNVDPEIFQGPT